ncbi:MAG: hypothetical protein CFH34_01555 [Alphaproteobacteria bacterium MarineAlpha9_Bin4]|nr:thioesterase [Pelagibacterales bacterium]PPR25167.1 MAG: hypothetical protein CFH34_01555 [Alphaproteobacteria bacterium MarineAlpha9_Bin4]|tara:strand:- start:423 stop:854 length:432 start_codon:yes stop_codon:yes gene_type:complete
MARKSYKFFYTLRARYAEVDAQGIVFNSHYLTYFDCAITEYFRKIKYNYIDEVKKNKKDFHVIKTCIEYKKPILFDQIIDVGVTVNKIGNSSITFDISLFSSNKDDLLAKGSIIQVYTDQIKKCATPLSKSFISKIKKFEIKS